MSKRDIENCVWNEHKEEIMRLYQHENLPLAQVITLMETSAGFKRTKGQYERRLKAWGAQKYSKAEDWKIIASCYQDRALHGSQTAVMLRGKMVQDRKVRKEIARHGYETAMDRFNRLNRPGRLTNGAPLPKSTEIQLFTPPGSPSVITVGSAKFPLGCPGKIQQRWSEEGLLILAETTPWNQFIVSMQSLCLEHHGLLVATEEHNDRSSTTDIGTNGNKNTVLASSESPLAAWSMMIFCSLYASNDLVDFYIHDACTNPQRYLPPCRDTTSEIDVGATLHLATRNTQLEFLKHTMNLVSNNFEVHFTGAAIVELLRVKQNRSLLQSLVDQKLLVAHAFLEKLWIPALRDSNFDVLKMILVNGYDIQAPIDTMEFLPRNVTALQFAIETGNESLVEFLLENGANGNETSITTQYICGRRLHNYEVENLLELAASLGKFSILRRLLVHRPQSPSETPHITMIVLRFAVLHGDMDTFQHLLDQAPSMYTQAQINPWILLEAAVAQKNYNTYHIITRCMGYEFDINAIERKENGSVLAAAYMSQDMDRIKRLCDMGANLSAVTKRKTHLDLNVSELERTVLDFRGMALLHLATAKDDTDTVAFLIERGVDVNQCCNFISPLQIAVYRRNEAIVDDLLQAGADVDLYTASGTATEYQTDDELDQVIGRPLLRIVLETGSSALFEKLRQHNVNFKPSLSPITESKILRWAIDGGNLKLVETVMKEYLSTASILPAVLANCILAFGYHDGFHIIKRCEGLDSAVAYSTEVLCAVVCCHDLVFLQDFLEQACNTLAILPRGYIATGLAIACAKGYYDMLQTFIDAGVKIYEPYNIPLFERFTAIYHRRAPFDQNAWSALTANPQRKETVTVAIFDTLLAACVEFERNAEDEELWKAALFSSCKLALFSARNSSEDLREMIPKLIPKGLDVNWIPPEDHSLLQHAVRLRDEKSARYFLSLGADPNAMSVTSLYPIHTALQESAICSTGDLLALLIQHGAEPSAIPPFSRGATATQFAAMYGNFENLIILLKLGVNINEPPGDHEGRTAIEGAAENGRLTMVEYLLQAGANVEGKTNPNYRRSVYRAWCNGHRTIANMIQNWKVERYGTDDCESIETILKTVTRYELEYADSDAYARHRQFLADGDEYQWCQWEDNDKQAEPMFQKARKQLIK
ncbi:unnamed protein product [Periconia digitata]|uniref:Clr5 domain-containing protein n=1 Tax=Periconia digitata TaxID=1303443 RepID=A0A9W4U273_9PLEO|nr:unnamed protein product [Periconia digitata]